MGWGRATWGSGTWSREYTSDAVTETATASDTDSVSKGQPSAISESVTAFMGIPTYMGWFSPTGPSTSWTTPAKPNTTWTTPVNPSNTWT